jgi:hypothetical protein
MFNKALQYRQNKFTVYQSAVQQTFEYIPWTSTFGERGIRTLLIKQVQLNVKKQYLFDLMID